MSDETPSTDDLKKLLSLVLKKRKQHATHAKRYRGGIKEKGDAQTIIRIDKDTLDLVREMSRLSCETLNATLVRIIKAEMEKRNQIFLDYAVRKITGKEAMQTLRVHDRAEFLKALVARHYHLDEAEKREYDQIMAREEEERKKKEEKEKSQQSVVQGKEPTQPPSKEERPSDSK